MERYTENKTEQVKDGIEKHANFEGNETELFFERVKNPIIKQQIVDLVHQSKITYADSLINETWTPFLPEGWTGEETIKLVKGEKTGVVRQAADIQYQTPSKEETENEIDEAIVEAMTATRVEFTADSPTADCIPLNWRMPGIETEPTLKQKTIMEAHEKGHAIRPYHGDFYKQHFLQGFDPSCISLSEDDIEKYRSTFPAAERATLTREQIIEEALHYLSEPAEIAERMSQLKNYFGMKGDELFTKEHLHYAQEHYIQDTGLDNGMTHFFQAISLGKEDIFIELINNLGI